MNRRAALRNGVAILACAAGLAGSAAAFPTGAAAAPAAMSCGSKTIKITEKGQTTEVPVSLISVSGGATCREATAVITGVVTKDLPRGWTVRRGNFQVPRGLVAQMATKGREMVRFALVGS